jgi:hypothetical protein
MQQFLIIFTLLCQFPYVSADFDRFSLGLEPMPYTALALMAQYLNVRKRKLGTMYCIIIQRGNADFWVTAHEGFLHGQLKLLPINLARQ